MTPWENTGSDETPQASHCLPGRQPCSLPIVGAIATYIENYYTTSVGQWVANDLRIRIYEHLHRLSLRYYDDAKTGTLMSTITSDVATIQNSHRHQHSTSLSIS